jgi:hypothetical protein
MLLFAACVLGAIVATRSLFIRPEDRPVTVAEVEAEQDRNDLKPGSKLVLPASFRQQLGPKSLLIFVGVCSECSARAEELLNLDISKSQPAFVIGTTEKAEAKFLAPNSKFQRISSDAILHKACNVQWAPRLACVTKDGTLVALQQRGESGKHFIERYWK